MKLKMLLVLLSGASFASAQLVYNKGALITITTNATVHVLGGFSNEDNAGFNGVLDNSGNLYIRTGAVGFNGDFTNTTAADVTLQNASRLYIDRHYANNATLVANNGSTVLFSGGAQQQFTRGASANAGDSFYNVTIQNTALGVNGVQLPAGALNTMVIRNQLLFDNVATPEAIIVTAANNYVYVQNTATNAILNYGIKYYINGRLRRNLTTANSIYFPVGDVPTGKGYQLAQLDHSALGGYTDVTASFTPTLTPTVLNTTAECGNDGYDAFLDNGRWIMDGNPMAVAKGTYTLTVYPRNFSGAYNGYNYAQYTGNASATIQKTPNNTTTWALDGTCNPASNLAAATPIVIRNNIPTGFSDFQIAVDINKPFPVEWLPLTATPNQNKIDLKFVTVSEVNCSGFELLKSIDGINFSSMNAFLPAQGPSTYKYADKDVQKEKLYYYKVKQVDNNGAYKYSNVAEAMLTDGSSFSAVVYPNPASNGATLQVNVVEGDQLKVELFNNIGQMISQTTIPVQIGMNEVDLSSILEKISAGNYSLRVQDQTHQTTIRLIKAD